MGTKPKSQDKIDLGIINNRDLFQTPNYAIDLLIPFIPLIYGIVWEPCCGQGKISQRLREKSSRAVISTDINMGAQFNMETYEPESLWDVIITNPPFSGKEKAYNIFRSKGKPFAILIPADWSVWVWEAVFYHGCQIIIPQRRIDYITPSGRSGRTSSSQFHSQWLTYRFELHSNIIGVPLSPNDKDNV